MTLHKNRHRQERRRRVLSVLFKAGLAGGVLATTAFYGYRVGVELERRDVAGLEAEVASLGAQVETSREEVQALRTALEDSRRSAEAYRVLAEQAPTGEDARELLRLVQAKLGAGLGKERLARYIGAAAAPKKCGEPYTRKFAPKVKGAKGETGTARLADGLVLSAVGVAAKNAAGRDEHWYDPSQPVTLVVAEPGGQQTESTGVLPLERVLVFKNSEYRFTAAPGPRGLISVAIDRCEMVDG